MIFDSMLLYNGGGVSNEFDRAGRVRILPTLAIGLGGTGVAALAEYKKTLWKRVVPDNPNGDVPQYRGISCLAIDSDPEELNSPRWKTVFSESEKLLLADRNLESQIRNGRLEWITRIKNDPCYRWFDAENVIVNGPLCGCHGNRQLGRYYLFEKINDLFRMLLTKISESVSGGFPQLTVHMFVGLSGGFGSGTFADSLRTSSVGAAVGRVFGGGNTWAKFEDPVTGGTYRLDTKSGISTKREKNRIEIKEKKNRSIKK